MMRVCRRQPFCKYFRRITQIPENAENPRAHFFRFIRFRLYFLEASLEPFQASAASPYPERTNAMIPILPTQICADQNGALRNLQTFPYRTFARVFMALALCGAAIFPFSLLAQTTPSVLLGSHPVSRLFEMPYSTWFQAQFDGYSPRQEILAELRSPKIQRQFHKTKIKIFLGSWCGDSQRDVK